MHVTSVNFSARMKVVYVTKCNLKGNMCACMCLSESHMCSYILVNTRRRKIGDGGHTLCVREAL